MKAKIELTIDIKWIRVFAHLAGIDLSSANEKIMCDMVTSISDKHLYEFTESHEATFIMARLLIMIYTSKLPGKESVNEVLKYFGDKKI